MYKIIRRWIITTFSPINPIEKYIKDNWNNPFDCGGINPKITRWIPDTNKSLEIIHKRYLTEDIVSVYINMELIISYNNKNEIIMDADEDELLYLYKNIIKDY